LTFFDDVLFFHLHRASIIPRNSCVSCCAKLVQSLGIDRISSQGSRAPTYTRKVTSDLLGKRRNVRKTYFGLKTSLCLRTCVFHDLYSRLNNISSMGMLFTQGLSHSLLRWCPFVSYGDHHEAKGVERRIVGPKVG